MAEREGFIMDNVKEKKVTQVEFYGMIREIVENSDVDNKAEILDFVDSRVALIKNRKRSESKASKANVELAEKVYDVLADADAPMTATEIYNSLNGVEGIASSQKVTALIKKLGDRVVKTIEKGKSKFSVAD
jgi:hypothetical protein